MTVDSLSAEQDEPGRYRQVARVLRQLKSSAVNGVVPAAAFEDATRPLGLTQEARERAIEALAEMGLRVLTPSPAMTAATHRSEHALALTLQYIPAGRVTREQLTRFGRLAGLNAREIASLPEHARYSGITVLEEEEPTLARPEPATTPQNEPDPVPDLPDSAYGLSSAVAAAQRLIKDDRFRADPGRRLLTAAEEVGLCILLRGGVDQMGVEPTDEDLLALPVGDIRRVARDTFVLHNTRLVYSIVAGYLGQGLEEEDLFQHGVLGLLRAVRKFDVAQGTKFSTYATWWIKQSITRAIADEGAAIRIPVHMHERMRKVARAESALRRDGKPATAVDVALATGLDVRTVDEVRALSKVTDSLDRIIGDGVHLGDLLFLSDPTPGPEEFLKEVISKEAVEEWLKILSEKEADILRRRLGLNGSEPETLEQIGRDYGVSRERIRQLEMRALDQIRTKLPKELRKRLPAHIRKRLSKKGNKSSRIRDDDPRA
ncbi:sigma-70 family RNA polymerase sigma factor [Spirillospora sp. NPDC127506]